MVEYIYLNQEILVRLALFIDHAKYKLIHCSAEIIKLVHSYTWMNLFLVSSIRFSSNPISSSEIWKYLIQIFLCYKNFQKTIHFNNTILDDWLLINGTCSLAPFLEHVYIYRHAIQSDWSMSVKTFQSNPSRSIRNLEFAAFTSNLSGQQKSDRVAGWVSTTVKLLP